MNNRLEQLSQWTGFPSLILVIALTIINGFLIPHFFTMSYLSSFLTSYTPLLVLAMAETVVLLGGGIDISIGSIVSLVNVVIISLAGAGWSFPMAVAMGVGSGLVIGVINGVAIAYLRITPLLVTLATSSIAEGTALWILPYPGGNASSGFIAWYQGTTIGVPSPLLFVIITYLLWLVWSKTPLGLGLLALGNNPNKAYVTGIPVARLQFLSYLFTALVASIAAVAVTGNTGAGDPTIGSTYTLNAVAACVIGGISLLGGIGDILGAVLGAAFLGLAFLTVFAANIPSYYQDLASGVIVVLGIVGASLVKKRQTRARARRL